MRTHPSVSRVLPPEAAPASRSPGVSYGRYKCEMCELLRRDVVCINTYSCTSPPNGISPLEVADRVRVLASLSFVVGRHDLVFEWSNVPKLQGTGVQYRAESVVDEPTFVEPTPWAPPIPGDSREHPVYPVEEP